ncbi:MAG: 30S ribosomal protein S6 [Candidatus Methylomirabilia bacterium]
MYEILVLIDPRPPEEEVSRLLTRLQETLRGLGAEVRGVENWGKRRLAYDVKKQREGIYAVFEVLAERVAVKEFERQLKLNENILRFLVTRVPDRRQARPAPPQEEPGEPQEGSGQRREMLEEAG